MSRLKKIGTGILSFAAAAGMASHARAAFIANPTITNNATPFSGSFPASNVFDGTPNDYASATQGTGTFIDFDFGALKNIDGFDIVDRAGASDAVTSYNLVFSADPTFGDAGDTTLSFTQNYAGVAAGTYLGKTSSFVPQNARYVRWQVTGVSGGSNNNGASEMRFRSAAGATRLAPGAVSVYNAQTSFSATYDKSHASDGLLGNGANGDYASNGAGANTFLDFDLGSTQQVNGFELVQRLAAVDRATSFDLIFSNSSDFSTVVATKSYSDSSMFVSDAFSAINARYVRFDVTGGSGNIGAQELSFTTVPEPASAGVIGLGIAGLGLVRRRRNTSAI